MQMFCLKRNQQVNELKTSATKYGDQLYLLTNEREGLHKKLIDLYHKTDAGKVQKNET